ncbi:MAG: hypothetical protein ACOYXC_04930 [Candidatus Rifleibacteriota bacterium]
MINIKPITRWLVAIMIFLFCCPLYSQSGERASRSADGVSSVAGRSGNAVINVRQSAGSSSQGQSTGMARESASGFTTTQSGAEPPRPQKAEDLSPAMIKSLVDGVFYVTASAIGDPNPVVNTIEDGITYQAWNDVQNPVFTRRGKLVKKDNFFGSGFEILINGQTFIPVDLKPRFQIEDLEVLVCYKPVAYTGGSTVDSITMSRYGKRYRPKVLLEAIEKLPW